jgi:hypothetical protein
MKVVICIAVAAGAALAVPASAHHSYAMFDLQKDVMLTGAVKDWQWTNPHTWLVLDQATDNGKAMEWRLEGSSPGVLRQKGWGREMVKAGDRVTVRMHPLKDGSAGGQISGITAADGHDYK